MWHSRYQPHFKHGAKFYKISIFLNSLSSRSPLSTVVGVAAAVSCFLLTHVIFPSLSISPVCSYAWTFEEEVILATVNCLSLWNNLAAMPPEPIFHGIAVGMLGKTGLFHESADVWVKDFCIWVNWLHKGWSSIGSVTFICTGQTEGYALTCCIDDQGYIHVNLCLWDGQWPTTAGWILA